MPRGPLSRPRAPNTPPEACARRWQACKEASHHNAGYTHIQKERQTHAPSLTSQEDSTNRGTHSIREQHQQHRNRHENREQHGPQSQDQNIAQLPHRNRRGTRDRTQTTDGTQTTDRTQTTELRKGRELLSEESKRKGRPHEFESPRPLTNRNNRGRSAKAEGMAMAKARYHRIAES